MLDSSSGGEPLAYLHGQGNIISGLEKALDGRQAGDKLSVRVEPADGYGVRDDSLVQQVPRRQFGGANVQPGMQFHAQTSHGHARVVTVTRIARRHGDRGRQPPARRRGAQLRRRGHRGPRRHGRKNSSTATCTGRAGTTTTAEAARDAIGEHDPRATDTAVLRNQRVLVPQAVQALAFGGIRFLHDDREYYPWKPSISSELLPGALAVSPWCIGREVPGFTDAELAARAGQLLDRGCPYTP